MHIRFDDIFQPRGITGGGQSHPGGQPHDLVYGQVGGVHGPRHEGLDAVHDLAGALRAKW